MSKKQNHGKYNFSKLFQSENFGQVLVTKETIDERPSLRIRISPNGVDISSEVQFDSVETRDDLFSHVTLDMLDEFINEKMRTMVDEVLNG